MLGAQQHLALQLEQPHHRVQKTFDRRAPHRDLVRLPQRGELLAGRPQLGDEGRRGEVVGAGGQHGPEVRDMGPCVLLLVLGRDEPTHVRVGEVAADHVPLARRPGADVAGQGGGHRVLRQHLAPVVDHHRRGVVQPVQDQQQTGPHMPGGRPVARRLLPHQMEEVVPLIVGEPQRAGQRGQHLPGRARTAGLLQAGVVVGGHTGQLGHLLAAQPWGAAARARAEPDVGG